MRPRNQAEKTEQTLLALALALLGIALAWHLYAARRRVLAEERTRLADQVRIIDANLGRQLGAVDNALVQVRDDLPVLLRPRDGVSPLDRRLRALSGAMPGVRTLFVMDAGGRVVASNRKALIGQDLHERGYFQAALRANTPGVLHVSAPIRNALGTYAINLERSAVGPDGAFAGLVAATLDPEYFATLLNSVVNVPDMWVSLTHADGTLFLIVPGQAIPAGHGLTRPGSLFRRHMDSGQAETVLVGRLLANGEWRMAARRTVHPASLPMDAPLVVAVTRNLSMILAPWRKDCGFEGSLYVLLVLTLDLGFRTYRRRRRLLAEADAARVKLERDLQARTSLFFDRQLVGMAITSPEQGWLQVNDRLCRMLGYTEAELKRLTWTEVTHPEDLAQDLTAFQALLDGTTEAYAHEKRYVRKDGGVVSTELSVGCVRHADGTVAVVLALVVDVTARKQAEAELRLTLREKEVILGAANVGISLMVDRRQIWGNPWMQTVFQYSMEELEGQTTRPLFPSQAHYEQLGREAYPAVARGEAFESVQEMVRRDGERLWIHCSGKAIDPAEPSRGVLWILHDITAQKRAEDELHLRQQELEDLNRSLEARVQEGVAELRAKDQILITQNRQAAVGEMIGHIAHQWRQPLNAMSLLLINIQDGCHAGTLDPERLTRMLRKGDGLVQKMSTTINTFRDFFQPAKARTAFSVLAQVRAAVAIVEAGFEARGIDLRIEASEDLTFNGLPNEFCQVLLNLLGNARQAIQDAGVAQGRITLALEAQEGAGCVRVTDNGGGIPAAALDRIFEPYFSTRPGGTGIGLYMSRQIIEESMQGRILARNREDGAEFTLRVPLVEARS